MNLRWYGVLTGATLAVVGTVAIGCSLGSSAAESSNSPNNNAIIVGGPGCGLDSAAFCDPFDAPSASQGRAGELDATKWSGARLAPQGPTGSGQAFGIALATLLPTRSADGGTTQLPPCRSGLPSQVYPDGDSLICDPSSDIKDPHFLVAVAAQNYGENSYRIRQPFDFAGRTGKIVFDAEGFSAGFGWISLDLTEDPIPAPGYSTVPGPTPNSEGTAIPENGFALQFNGTNGGGGGLSLFSTFQNYVETDVQVGQSSGAISTPTEWGKLNHFEVTVSQQKIEVYISAPSVDGVTFPQPQLVYSTNVNLPFSRGYVHITAHNHATYKYTSDSWAGNQGFTNLDAWVARWDNVGFDGPVITQWREYELSDPLTPYNNTSTTKNEVNTGWTVADAANGPNAQLVFHGVDPTGATTARIALDAWYCMNCGLPAAQFDLKYRLNGKSWHDRMLSAGELAYVNAGMQGALAQMLDVPIAELARGDNVLELETSNVPQNYPPGVVNVDLVLTTP